MTISIQLPPDIEQFLRQEVADLNQAAKEALLVDLYRQRKLSIRQLSTGLGLSPLQTDAVLKRHEVYYDQTAEDVIRESEGLRKLRDENGDRR